ncbi:unnamed protein product, partial [Onchocerca ochengi]|uniref:Uncharacterized protein n=1 Tax=Onchocerca ochengi TaxID=42157 RepID=A0A182F055_ONCOC
MVEWGKLDGSPTRKMAKRRIWRSGSRRD